MEQKDTLLEKSDVFWNDEKLSADTTTYTIPMYILNTPSFKKIYMCKMNLRELADFHKIELATEKVLLLLFILIFRISS